MNEDVKMLTFNIEGKFITQLAREWMFYEGREFETVMDLLLSCMGGTEMSEKELRREQKMFLSEELNFQETQQTGLFA